MQLTAAEAPMRRPKEKPMVNLHFPKGGLDPKGFETATVGQKVTVTITAIVRRVEDSADHWDPGKRMGLEMTACSIQGLVQAPSLNKALTSAKRTV